MSATCPNRIVVVAPEPPLPHTAYWHGGVPGLKVGDYILPPSITRTRFTLSAYVDEGTLRPGYQPTRVYMASEREVAEVFAAMYPGGGWVYLAVPEGQLELDPDDVTSGMSWACERARIVEVVPLDAAQVVAILESIFCGSMGNPQDLCEPTQHGRADGRCECGCSLSRHNNGPSGCTDCGYIVCPAFRPALKGGAA